MIDSIMNETYESLGVDPNLIFDNTEGTGMTKTDATQVYKELIKDEDLLKVFNSEINESAKEPNPLNKSLAFPPNPFTIFLSSR